MILPAQLIRRRAEAGMIKPFAERGIAHGRSYGLGPCTYDVRLAQDIWLWPFWGRLASTVEVFDMPDDVVAEVKDKSSNARLFVLVQNTLIDPGFRGGLTLELTRFLPWPIRLKAGTPIAQIKFSELIEPTCMPYRGKYYDQSSEPEPVRFERIGDLPMTRTEYGRVLVCMDNLIEEIHNAESERAEREADREYRRLALLIAPYSNGSRPFEDEPAAA